jgi:hypothetical protein
MAGMPVKTWKASEEDLRNLKALKKAKIAETESDLIRMGLKSLVKEKGVKV